MKPRINWDAEPRLGVVPDVDLARALGVTRVAVRSARLTRGLPSPGKAGRARIHRAGYRGTHRLTEERKRQNRAGFLRWRAKQQAKKQAAAVDVKAIANCYDWGDP